MMHWLPSSKRVRLVLATTAGLLLAVIIYTGVYHYHAALIDVKLAGVVCTLGEDICYSLHDFREENGRWPESLHELETSETTLVDPTCDEEFVYFPERSFRVDRDSILVIQPKAVQTRLWPFRKYKRYALLVDGSIRDVLYNETKANGVSYFPGELSWSAVAVASASP